MMYGSASPCRVAGLELAFAMNDSGREEALAAMDAARILAAGGQAGSPASRMGLIGVLGLCGETDGALWLISKVTCSL